MAEVHVSNVVVLDNPASFLSPFQFEITFECIEELKEDLEWKIIYVGSAESEAHDQVLDSVFVGPVPEGRHMFVFQADPPNTKDIPENDAVGVTVVLLTCSYKSKEFVRVGYYVNNEYSDPELRENPPPVPIYEKLTRNILATQPRITRFKIEWDEKPAVEVCGGDEMSGDVPSSNHYDNSSAPPSFSFPVPTEFETSTSSGPNTTNLHMNLNLSSQDSLAFDNSTSSLLEPPGPLVSGSNGLGDNENSMVTPMEVL